MNRGPHPSPSPRKFVGWLVGWAMVSPAFAGDGGKVAFDRDIRPILSEHCLACHGPDSEKRAAGLRLDTKDGALAELESGEHAIVPGVPDESALVERITTEDSGLRMPPKKFGKPLTEAQIELLKRWVTEGAEITQHWAFVAPKRPAVPVADSRWPRNEVDRFLLAKMKAGGLEPSAEADRATLIRRLSLDLTGLPPTPKEVDAFLADDRPDAYDRLVDRLLDSPRYGEHMARFWLDAARYGDTHGLHLDNYREIWPYRDWVIDAFQRNKPYDRFVTEQLAGDLLPEATTDQIIATGYNRCHISTGEGGSIEEEVYVRNVIDQVETNGTVFLGLTIGCARCHDHKYDPVTIKDFYSLFAFFNNNDGRPMDGNAKDWAPILKVPTPEQADALKAADGTLAEIRAKFQSALDTAKAAYDPKVDDGQDEVVRRVDYAWIDDSVPAGADPAEDADQVFVDKADGPVRRGGKALRVRVKGRGQRHFQKATSKLKLGEGDRLYAHVFLDPLDPPKEIMLQWHTGDWKHRAYWGANLIDWGKDESPERLRIGDLPPTGEWVRLEVDIQKLGLTPGTAIDGWAFTQFDGTAYWDDAGLCTWTPQDGQTYDTLTEWLRARKVDSGAGLPKPLLDIVKLDRSKRSEAQRTQLLNHFLANGYAGHREVLAPIQAELAKSEAARKAIDDTIPTTMIYKEKPGDPKPAFLLNRGEYDQPRDRVDRAIPGFLPPIPEGAPLNRLGFARWLTMPTHPLTARVAANRFWQQVFGTGLVKTAEDFGLQGEPASHPELLDWLAVEFREDGWDVKRFIRRLVTSAAYRQSAKVTPDQLAKDPSNRLLARGPRFRLDAETLRDQALYTGGLLVEQVGGPGVKPPQPSGLWEAVAYTSSNTAKFQADTGPEKVHRRSLYTFWKRTSPPPQLTTFDAPSRESCIVRRERTNTPLQALLLMNDPQYVEASRALAARTIRDGGSSVEERLAFLFRIATSRRPEPKEFAELTSGYQDLLAHYKADAEAAKQLIAVGETKPDGSLDPAELAAWTLIANTVLNLDEVVSKG